MGDLARTAGKVWTAEEFLRTDQREFGDAWRYELVDGRIVAHAAPSPAHARIVAALTGALTARMSGDDGCFPESGSGAAPENQQQANARIPDVMIRCRGLPRVLFEVLSPSELAVAGTGSQATGRTGHRRCRGDHRNIPVRTSHSHLSPRERTLGVRTCRRLGSSARTAERRVDHPARRNLPLYRL